VSHSLADLLDALSRSHEHLADSLASVDDVEAPAYPDEWSVAQVASHLGSGAAIFTLLLDAGSTDGDAPGAEQMKPLWDEWDAKSPREQVSDAIVVDAAFVPRIRELAPSATAEWRLEFFGMNRDLPGLVRMRLGEHLMHTWDIAVAGNPSATIDAADVGLTFGDLPALVSMVGKGSGQPAAVLVETTDSGSRFVLDLAADGVTLTPLDPGEDRESSATLRLPDEAFARLLYGRLDPDHTPDGVEADGVDLDTLRAALPGF